MCRESCRDPVARETCHPARRDTSHDQSIPVVSPPGPLTAGVGSAWLFRFLSRWGPGRGENPTGPGKRLVVIDRRLVMQTQTRRKEDVSDQEKIDETAERLLDLEVLVCQSALVDSLLRDATRPGWTCEEIENLWHEADDMWFDACYAILVESGSDTPEPDPYAMGHEQLLEAAVGAGDEVLGDGLFCALDEHELRRVIVGLVDEGIIDGLEDWRDAVRELPPREIFEWWLVTPYLLQKLRNIGEPVIENAYGNWWGRTCTGQCILMDGTLQLIARRMLAALIF